MEVNYRPCISFLFLNFPSSLSSCPERRDIRRARSLGSFLLPRAQCFVLDQKGTRGTMGRCHISCWTALRPLNCKHGQPSGQPTLLQELTQVWRPLNHFTLFFYSIVLVICKWERNTHTHTHISSLGPSSICIFFTKLSSPSKYLNNIWSDKIFPVGLSTRTLFGSWDHNSQIN